MQLITVVSRAYKFSIYLTESRLDTWINLDVGIVEKRSRRITDFINSFGTETLAKKIKICLFIKILIGIHV